MRLKISFSMRRLLFPLLILIVSLVVGYHILSLWRGASFYQTQPSRENLLKAIRHTPSNPDLFYRLSLFYQWDIRHIDLKESLHFLKKAIERNPLEQEYWLNLARILQKMEEKTASERALENAIFVFPTAYRGRWVSGNLLLQQGNIEKALLPFSYILSHYPNQSHLVYDVLREVIDDPVFFLDRLVPKDPSSFRQYLSYLYEAGDQESAQKVWQRRDSFGYKAGRSETLRHIEFLISHGEFNGAFQVWKERLREEGLPASSDRNLITNGGFEREKVLGGGFDWKIENVSGAEISFDSSTAFEGKNSLKIIFHGKENVDFHHIYQFVPLKSNTEYVLKAHMKTEAITTKSGPKIEIIGRVRPFQGGSEILTGDNEWKEVAFAFKTPAQLQGGIVRIRREKTDKFDRFISGIAWIDEVILMEK